MEESDSGEDIQHDEEGGEGGDEEGDGCDAFEMIY